MTSANPWVTAAQNAVGRAPDQVVVPELRAALAVPPATGPTAPQTYVTGPTVPLPVQQFPYSARLWVVGAHGGAGESSLAELGEYWVATQGSWPEPTVSGPTPCVVVARTHGRGLIAAREALRQWASGGVGRAADVVGLVLMPDSPGKLPTPLKDLAAVIGGGSPRVWQAPWVESWRFGGPVNQDVPRSFNKIIGQLQALSTTFQPSRPSMDRSRGHSAPPSHSALRSTS
ncbi:MAG: DUF6668 family protein [Angustibacter sp.]